VTTSAVVPRPRLPRVAALVSRVLDGYVALGGYRFEPEALWSAAIRSEGHDDFGPAAASLRRGLEVYCESLERDAQPHGLGRFYLHRRVCGIGLRASLRIAASVRAGLGPARPPLVVCGLPRSGTTLLHRLLEQADGAAGIPFWQLADPMPPPRGPDRRRRKAELSLSRLRRMVPLSLDAQHVVRPDLSDECGHLLRCSFVGSMPWQIPAFGWLEWSLQQDLGPAYRQWAAFLHHLEPPGRRLVLKDPFHAGCLAALLAACPGATLVQTHRDPLEVVPSFHKLCTTMHAVLVPRLDLPRTIEAHTRWLEHVVERNAEGRRVLAATGRGDRVIDVRYAELLADPIAVVERIHGHLGIPTTAAELDRMRAWLASNHQRKHGPNPYDARAFGQRPEELAERFAAYREAWGYPEVVA
jgi:hypothetical protein